jgi:hypothetical protein
MMAAQFPFADLHSFKDYIVFVQLCLPDNFPRRGGAATNAQWTPTLAFEGLRLGLKMATKEKGTRPEFVDCNQLVMGAEADYGAGRIREGFAKLEDVIKLLKKVPSQ